MTDVGMTRSSNEDNFLINHELGIILIGDGMGGHEAGEVASAEALLAVCDFIKKINPPQQNSDFYTPTCSSAHDPLYDPDATLSNDTMPIVMRLYDAVEFANSMLYAQNLAKNNEEGCGMGTTLTGFWQVKKDGPVVFFHVGDSRLYRYREGELSQLTRDQTLYQQAIEQGMLEDLPPRNKLLQAVGPSAYINPEVRPVQLQADDLYLFCTDGLHGSVPHGLIADILSKTHTQNLDQSCSELISLSKEHGSQDNITVVLLAC